MVKLVSAVLSLTMLFGAGTTPTFTQVTANVPVTVGVQQAVYEKYSNCVVDKTEWELVRTGDYGLHSCPESVVFRSVAIDENTGTITGNEYVDVKTLSVGETIARIGNSTTAYIGTFAGVGTSGYAAWFYTYKSQSKTIKVDAIGSYITNIITDCNSLPSDGRHTDGYWYVFKNLVEE